MKRILLVSLDNLGDVVFASSLTPPLHERYPSATIDVWCKTYTADVARLIPHVRDVIASDPFWDKAPGRGKGSFSAFWRAVRRARAGAYDAAILSAAPWRTAAAVAATGIPIRVGLSRRRNARFLTHVLASEDVNRPVLTEMARVLEPFGIEEGNPRYQLDSSRLAPRVAGFELMLRLESTGKKLLALHPFASKRNRCVPLDIWRAVAHTMKQRGFKILWIGSATELDELRSAEPADDWHYVDLLGGGSLAETAAALSMASLFAGHDSGPLHIAGAFGVPVLGIFAPGEPRRTFPQGVGEWRMIARDSPGEVTASEMVEQLESLTPLRSPAS